MEKTKSSIGCKFKVGKGLVDLIKKNSIKSDITQKLKAHKVTISGTKKAGVKYKVMPDIGMGVDTKVDYSQIESDEKIISDEIEKVLTGIAMSSSANKIEITTKSGFTQVAGRDVIRNFGLDVNKDNSEILKGLIDVFKKNKKSEFAWGSIEVKKNGQIILYVNRDKMAKPITLAEIAQQETKWQPAPELIKLED